VRAAGKEISEEEGGKRLIPSSTLRLRAVEDVHAGADRSFVRFVLCLMKANAPIVPSTTWMICVVTGC
jgi:hypothetical protein